MNSCLSLGREKRTEEVIPAKQVTDAALTFQIKQNSDMLERSAYKNVIYNNVNYI